MLVHIPRLASGNGDKVEVNVREAGGLQRDREGYESREKRREGFYYKFFDPLHFLNPKVYEVLLRWTWKATLRIERTI